MFVFFLEWRNFCINNLKYITSQTSHLKYLIPSLITLNTNRLLGIYECEISKKSSLKIEDKSSKVSFLDNNFILITKM